GSDAELRRALVMGAGLVALALRLVRSRQIELGGGVVRTGRRGILKIIDGRVVIAMRELIVAALGRVVHHAVVASAGRDLRAQRVKLVLLLLERVDLMLQVVDLLLLRLKLI